MSNFPFSDVIHKIPIEGGFYTKKEVDKLIKDAVDEARRIDEESMRKHNRDATIISMILGFTTLALFVDGLLRLRVHFFRPALAVKHGHEGKLEVESPPG